MQFKKLLRRAKLLSRSSTKATLAIILASSCLGACATAPMGSLGTDVACQAFNPVHWSHQDTQETQRQVVGNNAVGVKLCPSVPKWKPGK